MANRFLAAACALFAIGAGLRCEAAGEIINLVPAIRAAGLQPVTSFANQYNVRNAYVFDGIVWTDSTSPDNRYLDSMWNFKDKGGLWIDLAAPESFRPGARFELRNYRLVRCPFWTVTRRQPTQWTVYGIPDGAKDDPSKWTPLDSRSGGPLPDTGSTAPESETNNFAVAGNAGFRHFRFVPESSAAWEAEVNTGNPDTSTFDLELYELEYDVEVFDTYRFTSASEIDVDIIVDGAFSPALGAKFNVETVFTAPTAIVSGGNSYVIRGYRLESFNKASGKWEATETVEGPNSYEFRPADDFADEQRRVVWLWKLAEYDYDIGATSLCNIFRWNDAVLADYAYGEHVHNNATGSIKQAFDGIEFVTNSIDFYTGGADGRWLGVRPPADGSGGDFSYIGLDFANLPPETVVDPGDSIWLKGYRVCALSYMKNEKKRAPTAWHLDMRANADSAWNTLDAKENVSRNSLVPQVEGANVQEFHFPEPVEIQLTENIRFTPTESEAHPQPPGTIEFGLMELTLLASVVNEKGTLRVYDSGHVSGDFAPSLGTLCTEAATIAAPESVIDKVTGIVYPCSGYRLEKFDYAECVWVLVQTSPERSFPFAPDANESYRLQWLVDWSDPRGSLCSLEVGKSNGNGRETVSVSPANENSEYAGGTQITLTATPSAFDASATPKAASEFVRWGGDVEGLDVDLTQSTITFAIDRPRKLHAVFRRCWALEGDTISDGTWTFRVEQRPSQSGKELKLAAHVAGSGDLDLSTYVGDASNWNSKWTITEIAETIMSGQTHPELANAVTSLVLPRELTAFGYAAFRTQTSMTNLVIDCPNLVNMSSTGFTRNTALESVTINAPKLKNMGANYTLYNAPLGHTSFEDWNLPELRFVQESMCFMQYFIDEKQWRGGGTLRLPRAEEVRSNAFYNNKRIHGIELGTHRGSLTNIASGAFLQSTLASVTIGSRAGLTVADSAFGGIALGSAETFEVKFTREAPSDRSVVDRILSGIEIPERSRLRVSSVRPEWREYVTPLSEVSDAALRSSAETLGADGVWMAGDGSGFRAFVFFERMPLDPKGFTLIVR